MPSAKILYFVRPEAKPPIEQPDLRQMMDLARKAHDDSRARQHFNDLLKGIWPTSQSSPA